MFNVLRHLAGCYDIPYPRDMAISHAGMAILCANYTKQREDFFFIPFVFRMFDQPFHQVLGQRVMLLLD